MKIIDVEQGTKEWHDSRRCKITGTKLKAVMGTGEARRGLIAELISEKATEQSKAIVTSAEMERGTGEEIFAIKEFEERTGKKVDRVGMCIHDEYDWIALSPDGLIKGEDGRYSEAVEVKCPDSRKDVLYRIENMVPMEETGLMGKTGPLAGAPFLGIPADYKWQVVHYFLVNKDLEKMNFIVYDARFINKQAKLYAVEVLRSNEVLQEAISAALEALIKFRRDWLAWEEIVFPTEF
jgi:hypothetical protein